MVQIGDALQCLDHRHRVGPCDGGCVSGSSQVGDGKAVRLPFRASGYPPETPRPHARRRHQRSHYSHLGFIECAQAQPRGADRFARLKAEPQRIELIHVDPVRPQQHHHRDLHHPHPRQRRGEQPEHVSFADMPQLVCHHRLHLWGVELLQQAVGDQDISKRPDEAHDRGVDHPPVGSPEQQFPDTHTVHPTHRLQVRTDLAFGQGDGIPGKADHHRRKQEHGHAPPGRPPRFRGFADPAVRDHHLHAVHPRDDDQQRQQDQQHLVPVLRHDVLPAGPDGLDRQAFIQSTDQRRFTQPAFDRVVHAPRRTEHQHRR